MKFMKKKISNPSNDEKITFCFEKKYVFEYKRVLIFLKSITIRNLPFFQTMKIENETEKMISNEIFCIRPFFVSGFKISFIAFLSLINMKYEICLKLFTSFSFLNEIDILTSSLNFSNSERNKFACLIKI